MKNLIYQVVQTASFSKINLDKSPVLPQKKLRQNSEETYYLFTTKEVKKSLFSGQM